MYIYCILFMYEKFCPTWYCAFVMLCPASLQLRCHFFVLVAICLGPQSTESLKPWGQDRQGHDIYLYAYLPQRKKNVRSCSYMNLIWWHLGTRHIISKFKYDNLTKAWQYVVKKGPWVKQTEIHDDSCRWDVDPLLKPSIIQIGSNWINRPNKPASTVKWWFINSSPDLTSSYHWSVQLCFTSVRRKVKQFLKCASAHVSGLCIFEHRQYVYLEAIWVTRFC